MCSGSSGIETLSFSGISAVVVQLKDSVISQLALASQPDTVEAERGRSKRSVSSAAAETLEIRLSFSKLDSNLRTVCMYNFTTHSIKMFELKVSVDY